jgi:hypothetical protein
MRSVSVEQTVRHWLCQQILERYENWMWPLCRHGPLFGSLWTFSLTGANATQIIDIWLVYMKPILSVSSHFPCDSFLDYVPSCYMLRSSLEVQDKKEKRSRNMIYKTNLIRDKHERAHFISNFRTTRSRSLNVWLFVNVWHGSGTFQRTGRFIYKLY